MKILVTGSNGMLGREFMGVGKEMGHMMIGWTRKELDLEKTEGGIRRLGELKPDGVVHCAAETHVDLCEQQPERAIQVNAVAAGNLAKAAQASKARFVFISTGGLFDGKKSGPYGEGDQPRPCTVYGQSKLEGERRVLATSPEALILRAGWLFGGPLNLKKNFVGARLREAEENEVIRSASDKRGSPTWTRDFAARALQLLGQGKKGLYHLANQGVATRQEYVAEILRLAGKKNRVEGVDSSRFPRPAPVPANESLRSERPDAPPMPDWKISLQTYLRSVASPVMC